MTKDELEFKLARLSCWRGPVQLARLEGGLTNISYVATDRSRKYVVRCGEDRPVRGTYVVMIESVKA